MKINLICTTCKKPIVSKKQGMFIWGFDTKINPFTIVHKGQCDNRKEYVYSMGVYDLIQRVNRKLTRKEINNPI